MLQNVFRVAYVVFEDEVTKKIVVFQYTVVNNSSSNEVNFYLMYTLL